MYLLFSDVKLSRVAIAYNLKTIYMSHCQWLAGRCASVLYKWVHGTYDRPYIYINGYMLLRFFRCFNILLVDGNLASNLLSLIGNKGNFYMHISMHTWKGELHSNILEIESGFCGNGGVLKYTSLWTESFLFLTAAFSSFDKCTTAKMSGFYSRPVLQRTIL